MEKKRINWIDWGKVFAITLIVFGHAPFTEENVFFRNLVYSYHVPFFFFISGYLDKMKYSNFKDCLKKNIKSLMIPYLVFNFIIIITEIPSLLTATDHSMFKFQFFLMIIGHGNSFAGPAWFLYCLFFIKLLSYLIIRYRSRILYSLVLTLIVSSFVLLYNFNKEEKMFFGSIPCVFVTFPFFFLGFVINKIDLSYFLQQRVLQLIVAFITLILTLYLCQIQGAVNVVNFGNFPILYIPQVLIGIILLMSTSFLFSNIEDPFIVVISTGTILIMGFHIDVFYFLLHWFGIKPSVLHNLILSIIVVMTFYFPIRFLQADNKASKLLGKLLLGKFGRYR